MKRIVDRRRRVGRRTAASLQLRKKRSINDENDTKALILAACINLAVPPDPLLGARP
ncbi:hypothetical protein [Aquincola tertiaricarbonis]|uniref:hypothetical protein n=1 Tax=Aquincola tertiaricarbonis TaxID=391953 RepID=UPI0012ED7DC2|nr:hypothetical protein [Aquincola tertiaricarbonis]